MPSTAILGDENIRDCLPPSLAERVSERIDYSVKKFLQTSRFVKTTGCRSLPQFHRDELLLGRLLGSGGFSQAFEIKEICPSYDNDDCLTLTQQDARTKLVGQSHRRSKGKNPFVVKHIQSKFLENPNRFRDAAVDLVVEANFLASINHPNILSIRGWALGGSSAFRAGKHDGFFILLDRLEETLDQRIKNWGQQLKRYKTPTLEKMATRGHMQKVLYNGRLSIARDIASALAYLHENGIIYRDLKPSNIGFDVDGNVKLFDFGLCREMPEDAMDMDDVYQMSGRVGTVRYMSPEVCKGEAYNQRADCYSLAMVVWEMFALEKPFKTFTKSMHRQLVVETGERPEMNPEWPYGIQALLHCSWSADIGIRPNMKQFHSILVQEILELSEKSYSIEVEALKTGDGNRGGMWARSKAMSSTRSVDTADTTITFSDSDDRYVHDHSLQSIMIETAY
jgi:serine/threonine protein kinase